MGMNRLGDTRQPRTIQERGDSNCAGNSPLLRLPGRLHGRSCCTGIAPEGDRPRSTADRGPSSVARPRFSRNFRSPKFNTCHSPRNGFTTHTETSRGVGDQIGKRNAPSILNAMFYKSMFWDGRAATLEEQATLPILNPIEMGQKDPKDVVAKLAAIPEVVDAFQMVFGRPPNWEDIGKALGAFERTRLSTEAPFDRFLHGDEKALNASQRRGWALFTGK